LNKRYDFFFILHTELELMVSLKALVGEHEYCEMGASFAIFTPLD